MADSQNNPIYTADVDQATEPMDVHIIRHGSTQMNSDTSTDRMRGWGDVPLDEEGKKESKAVAQQMKDKDVKFLFHSDLSRARDTANDVAEATGAQLVSMPELRTWHIGNLEGAKSADANPLLALYATRYPDVSVPGGESFNEFKDRVLSGVGMANRVAQGQPYAIVSHHKVERVLNAWDKAGQPHDGTVNLNEFLAEGEEPGSIQTLPIGVKPVTPPDVVTKPGQKAPDQKPISTTDTANSIKDLAYDMFVPDSLKPVSDETWKDYHKRMSEAMKNPKAGKMNLPDVGQDPAVQFGKGIVDALGMFSPPAAEAGIASKALFLGLGGMKRLLGNQTFKDTTDLAERIAVKYAPLVETGTITQKNLESYISHKTGVTFGADDLPRYEISNKDIQLKPDLERWVYDKDSTYEKTNSTPWSYKDGYLVIPAYNSPTTLDKVIDAPRLFQAYPDLKNVIISDVAPGAGFDIKGHAGWEKSGEYRIAVASGPDKEVRSTLLHEIQHYVQDTEKFGQGGNPSMYTPDRLPEAEAKLNNGKSRLDEAITKSGFDPYTIELILTNPELYMKEPAWFTTSRAKKKGDVWDVHVGGERRTIDEVNDLINRFSKTGHREAMEKYIEAKKNLEKIHSWQFRKYQELAGETEARNTQKRDALGLTDDPNEVGFHTREIMPEATEDVPRDRQKVIR